MIGNTLGPDEAFRFARGEKVRASAGDYAQLIRPLDFLIVADQAENLGLAPMVAEFEHWPTAQRLGSALHDLAKEGNSIAAHVERGAALNAAIDRIGDDNLQRTM